MAATQTILFTVIPRGISVNPQTFPVSVLVSPRLVGANNLGAFPDWVAWTSQLKEHGLVLTFRSGTRLTDVHIDTAVLQPELWSALFTRDTLVRSRRRRDASGDGPLDLMRAATGA